MIQAARDHHSDGSEAMYELSHRLPMAAYHATERWQPERIGAMALYCSDGRWGEAFDEFCHRHLQIPRYDRWAMPGGPAWLAGPPPDPLPQAAPGQPDFLVQAPELERILLITHFRCPWDCHKLKQPPEECLQTQV